MLTPIYTNKTKLVGDQEQLSNIRPKISNTESLVTLRSVITPDNEPNFFTTLFNGAMVIRSFDFLQYGKDDEWGNVMLFQLIGVPHINQRAVEVQVNWSSLSTTGLYVMLADDNIFFWIGMNYFARYTTTDYLCSDEMLRKLNYVYEQESSTLISEEKSIHYILQGLESELFIRILTKEGEFSIDMPDYESSLIYNNMILPKLPRCFCLYENGLFLEYSNDPHDIRMLMVENLNLDQLTLKQKGVYYITVDSDVFIWIGSRVDEADLFKVLTDMPIKIPNQVNLHIIHEYFEPEVFTEMFQSWKHRSR